MSSFNDIVTSEQELRDMLGVPDARSLLKERPRSTRISAHSSPTLRFC